MTRQRLLALFIAGVLAVILNFVNKAYAQDDELVMKPIHPCDTVEKYGWLWYAMYCDLREEEEGQAMTAQSMTVEPDGTVTVEREYANGARRVFTGRKVK